MMYDIQDFQWQLDVDPYSLDDHTINLLFACDMLQENHMSLRRCEESLIPKSTLHDFITYGRLSKISSKLYRLCIKQLNHNKRNAHMFKKYVRK